MSDVGDLLDDPRLTPCGISDFRSGMSASGDAEGYVRPGDLDRLVADYLLSEIGHPNVWLHVSERDIARPAPLGLVVADLADHDGPREDAQLERLLGQRP